MNDLGKMGTGLPVSRGGSFGKGPKVRGRESRKKRGHPPLADHPALKQKHKGGDREVGEEAN